MQQKSRIGEDHDSSAYGLPEKQTPKQTPIFRTKKPRPDKLLSDQDLAIGTVGFEPTTP